METHSGSRRSRRSQYLVMASQTLWDCLSTFDEDNLLLHDLPANDVVIGVIASDSQPQDIVG